MNNFDRGFDALLERAGIENGEYHDLRRTCLSRWLANGLTEYDVMQLGWARGFFDNAPVLPGRPFRLGGSSKGRHDGRDEYGFLARSWRAPRFQDDCG